MRPSCDSLNSLRRVLQNAMPVYDECASIIRGLPGASRAILPVETLTPPDEQSINIINKNAHTVRHTLLELVTKRTL